MINAQEWLDKNYPDKENVKSIDLSNLKNIDQPSELVINDYSNLETIDNRGINVIPNITKVIIYNCLQLKGLNITNFTDNQELEIINCPNLGYLYCGNNHLTNLNVSSLLNLRELRCQNNQLIKLDLKNNNKLILLSCEKNKLTELNTNSLANLKSLNCIFNQLNTLDLNNLVDLEEIYCRDNQLVNTNFLATLPHPNKLTILSLRNNNIIEQDLSAFNELANLKDLWIGNDNKEKIERGFYNRFYGSLEPLKKLTKLKNLNIENTDVDSGSEYLPNDINEVHCSSKKRPVSLVNKLNEELNKISNRFYIFQDKYITRNPQYWLDQNYPKEKRNKVEEIYLTEPSLQGELDLKDFTFCWGKKYVKVYISTCIDETKLIIKNKSEAIKIVSLDAQRYMEQQFLTEKKITKLDIKGKKLEGKLDLSDFASLEELECSENKLTSLSISNCYNLTKLNCANNFLTSLTLPFDPTNLNELNLENNELTGSLDYLSEMKQLKKLVVSDTNLNEIEVNELPVSLEEIYYSTQKKSTSKLVKIVPQLKEYEWKDIHPEFTLKKRKKWEGKGFNKEQTKEWIQVGSESKDYDFVSWLKSVKKLTPEWNLENKKEFQELRKRFNWYGLCKKCQQINTSENWCQSCQEREWKQDLERLTGQEVVEKFIQCQTNNEWNKLEWIPYESFKNIEHIADGGFGKIYKAKWERKDGSFWNVVLKSLNNSQKNSLEFLNEIANTKLVDFFSDNSIVQCYGISQDSETNNYIMVMEYMHNGNLRQHLQQKFRKLSLNRKLKKLENIILGLDQIHRQGLIHRDFHAGNILNDWDTSYITDFGLSKPASFQLETGEIFGVLPYVAPEVLRGEKYTQASDIYSFGIVAYELFTNAYPYYELKSLEGIALAIKICQGLRPNLDDIKMPQLLKDLIKSCWNVKPEKRPAAEELRNTIKNWEIKTYWKENTEFTRQLRETEAEYNRMFLNTPYRIHPTAALTSKSINTKQITEKLKIMEYSESLVMDFRGFNLENKIEDNLDFTPELIQSWTSLNFSPSQTQDWLNIGLQPTDHHFASYLHHHKHLTPEEVLNQGNEMELREEYQTYQEQLNQIEQPPKGNKF